MFGYKKQIYAVVLTDSLMTGTLSALVDVIKTADNVGGDYSAGGYGVCFAAKACDSRFDK